GDADPAPDPGRAPPGSRGPVAGARRRPPAPGQDGSNAAARGGEGRGGPAMNPAIASGLAPGHLLALGAVLFCIAVAGIFLSGEDGSGLLRLFVLMLLAVNVNFVAFSRQRGDAAGQVFVFFILTVAAAEAAIGRAILVTLFRNRRTINVADIDTLKG